MDSRPTVMLTLSWRRSLSYKNQSIGLLKSMDWFLYDRNLRHERIKISGTFLVYNEFHTNKMKVDFVQQNLQTAEWYFCSACI